MRNKRYVSHPKTQKLFASREIKPAVSNFWPLIRSTDWIIAAKKKGVSTIRATAVKNSILNICKASKISQRKAQQNDENLIVN